MYSILSIILQYCLLNKFIQSIFTYCHVNKTLANQYMAHFSGKERKEDARKENVNSCFTEQ